ncbi:MAG: AAA family ATPase [SAR202 cluster bacterium]|nr:AAA family ATPase [SAR202 cluster bacterium]
MNASSQRGPIEEEAPLNEPRPTRKIVDDLDRLVAVLPLNVQTALSGQESLDNLLEVVLDLGRPPEARYPNSVIMLSDEEVGQADIQWVVDRVGAFGDDNRAGIERTLHRISVIRNRAGVPVGLTCRVGRAVYGTIKIIEDLVLGGQSVLLMGRPGVGKTTMLREVARVLADDARKRVVIVDTSNEIAGDGNVPHPAIGKARRMQVPNTPLQHHVMIEAVENHMPEVIIIDEMSTELEALAARTIAERGVQLIATAHGNTLDNLVSNPSLSDLVGGTQTVTLGDEEARRRRTQKTILERKQRPTFNVVVEIRDWNHVGVHKDVAPVVDAMLRGFPVRPEVRWVDNEGEMHVEAAQQSHQEGEAPERGRPSFAPSSRPAEVRERKVEQVRVLPFGIPSPMLRAEASLLGVPVEVVDDASNADVLLTTKAHYGRRPPAVRTAEQGGTPVYVLRKGSTELIRQFLRRFETSAGGNGHAGHSSAPEVPAERPPERGRARPRGRGQAASSDDTIGLAMAEAESAVRKVLDGEARIELAPQTAFVRRLQHGLATRYNVGSASVGADPERRVVLRRRRQ